MRHVGTLRGRHIWIGLLALFGIAIGHVLAYLFAEPDAVARAQVLASSGHGYWRSVLVAAAGAGLAGLAAFVLSNRDAGSGRGSESSALFRFSLRRFTLLQVGGFLLLEAVERVVGGGGLAHLVLEPAVILGVALQVVVAVAMASLLLVVARVVETLVGRRSLGHLVAEASPLPLRLQISRRLVEVGAGGATLRGPPGGWQSLTL